MTSINDLNMHEVSAIIRKYKNDHTNMVDKLNKYVAIALINRAVNQGLIEATSVQQALMNLKNSMGDYPSYGRRSPMDILRYFIALVDARIRNLIIRRKYLQQQPQQQQRYIGYSRYM